MSNAELIAALRRKAKFFSIWRDAEGQNETEILLLQAAAALEKSEAEVVRLGGVIDEVRADARVALILHADDDEYQSGVRDQAGDTLGIINRATVSAEEGAE